MARVECWFDQDLQKPVVVRSLHGNVFSNDDNGTLIGVKAYKNGQPETLSGTCVGYCILSNGSVVAVPGVVGGNMAYITLPASTLGVHGTIKILLKLTSGNDIATLLAVVSSVYNSDGIEIDPSSQQIADWTSYIQTTLAGIAATSVRYDTSQSLTTAQKNQAKSNIDANVTAVQLSGDDYKLVFP